MVAMIPELVDGSARKRTLAVVYKVTVDGMTGAAVRCAMDVLVAAGVVTGSAAVDAARSSGIPSMLSARRLSGCCGLTESFDLLLHHPTPNTTARSRKTTGPFEAGFRSDPTNCAGVCEEVGARFGETTSEYDKPDPGKLALTRF